MTFANPIWLIPGGLLVAGLIIALVLLARRRRAVFAAAGLPLAAGVARPIGAWFSIAGIAALALGVAEPAASVPVAHAAGTVVVAIDVSNSMAATDVDPSRLEAAKRAATAFVEAQPTSVDIAVVAFQSDALQTGLTTPDHAAAVAAIQRVSGTGGTSLANALLGSLSAIVGRQVTLPEDDAQEAEDLGYWGSATIVLFSDGEDFGSADPDALQAAAELCQGAGVQVETVGIGTTAGTQVSVDGYNLHTALDEDTLKSIAETTAGSYHPAGETGELDQIARQISLRFTVKNQEQPLAWASCGLAVILLGVGAALTLGRTGRLI
jgi:Ca-activated chloride channel family protein